VLVIGVAFKPGVSDDRNSPAGPLIAELDEAGARVSYHDPHVPRFVPEAIGTQRQVSRALESVPFDEALAAAPDCVVIVTPHASIDWASLFAKAQLVVDTRDVSRGHSVRPGQVLRLGAGWS
jgi:UDP-N-acetyl-D-glucosamine dehydrogenase